MRQSIRGFILVALTFLSGLLFGQVKDTIRENTNYQYQTNYQESGKSGKFYHYVGFQANQLLRQLIGSAGGGDNPYTITYSFNSVQRGRGMSFGLGYSSRTIDVDDPSSSVKSTTKSGNLAIRVGYDWKQSIGKKWVAGIAIDAFRDGGSSETTTTFSNGPEIKSNSGTNSVGLGPRLSLLFNVSGKIFLGTEASILFKSIKTTSKTNNPNFPVNNERVEEDRSLSIQAPVALFLIVRF
jgi:hypothetical protein